MIEVELPDGSIAEFPDGTSPDVMKGALKKRFAKPEGGLLQAAGSGLRSGAEMLAGLPGDAATLMGQGAGWAASKFAGAGDSQKQQIADMVTRGATAQFNPIGAITGNPTTTADIQEATNAIAGPAYEPQTTAEKYVRTGAEFLPGLAAGGPIRSVGQGVARGLTQVALPAIGSETGGQLTEGTAAEPYARIAGALMGSLAPSAMSRAVTPFPASPERLKLAETLANEGVDLTAGQKTGSNFLRYRESELGGGAAERMMEQQGEQFTKAAMSRVGSNSSRASPEAMEEASTRIGKQFDDLASRNDLVADPQMGADLRSVFNEYGQLVPPSARAPVVENITRDIVDAVGKTGGLSGDAYKSLTSRLFKLSRSSDPEVKGALLGIRSVLDDTMERSIAANNPSDAGAWKEARNQYKNLLVLEQAATGAGEAAASGIISPSQLRNATVNKGGRRAYSQGRGDFDELARAGEGTMKPLPNSGTASRLMAHGAGSGLGGVIGALIGGPIGAGVGAAAGTAIPAVAGRGLLSGPGRAYLGNQLMAGKSTADPRVAALIAALMGQESPQALSAP